MRSVGGQHRDVDEETPQRGLRRAETPTPSVSDSSAVRALLTGMVDKDDASPDDVLDRRCTSRSALSSLVDNKPELTEYRRPESVADKLRHDCTNVQEAALNFSTRTSDEAPDNGASPTSGAADVKIKDEVPHPTLPMTYGLELGGTFDMTRSMSVAAAAAAFSQYVDDPAMLQSLTPYDQQRLALYTSLVTAAAASGVPAGGCEDGQPPPMSLLNGAGQDSTDLPSSTLDRPLGMSSYAISGRLGDSLTMHRLPAIGRRERFDRGLHHSHQPPLKVRLSTMLLIQHSFTRLREEMVTPKKHKSLARWHWL